jgi:hypothetical protein
MPSHVKWFLTAALAVLVASSALGQLNLDMTPFLEDGLGASALLLNKGVQKEIHLTDEQRDKVAKIVRDAFFKYQPDIQKAKDAGDLKKLFQVMRESLRKFTLESRDKVNKAIPDILKEEQIKRLKQIELQVNVIQTLNKPDMQRKLKFTDRQKAEVKEIADGFKEDFIGMMKTDALRKPQERVRKAAEMVQATMKLSDEANRKAMKTFTDEQKKTWKEMTGAKFEYKPDALNLSGARP